MFDLSFCSHYIIEYILLAYFCLETKMKMAVVYCNNWSSGTLYMCVVSIMYAYGWMCGLTAIPLV